MPSPPITDARAAEVGERLKINWAVVPKSEWRRGLEVELEHGSQLGPATNVTQDDLLATGRIALAHLVEDPGYYTRLAKMEAEAERHWAGRTKPSPVRGGGAMLRRRLLWALAVVAVGVLVIVLLRVARGLPSGHTPAAPHSRVLFIPPLPKSHG